MSGNRALPFAAIGSGGGSEDVGSTRRENAMRESDQTDPDEIVTVLLPEDEYTHTPDAAENYNESMYLNVFDLGLEVGGWFRLGNRVNEGHAEMSVCIYLPDGRVGFMYDRPKIDNNDAMDAGGLTIRVKWLIRALRSAPTRWSIARSGSTTAPCHQCTAAGPSTPTAGR